jgi:hypothetical protein
MWALEGGKKREKEALVAVSPIRAYSVHVVTALATPLSLCGRLVFSDPLQGMM